MTSSQFVYRIDLASGQEGNEFIFWFDYPGVPQRWTRIQKMGFLNVQRSQDRHCFSRFTSFFSSEISRFFCLTIPEVSGGFQSLGFKPFSPSLETPDLIS